MNHPTTITLGKIGKPKISRDGRTMLVSIPVSFRRQGGRKRVVTPAATASFAAPARVNNTLVKALVRAHRWRGMLEANLFATVRELAKAEKINESYLCRLLRLTLLSPNLTEAILNGYQPEGLELAQLFKSIPTTWDEQEAVFGANAQVGYPKQ